MVVHLVTLPIGRRRPAEEPVDPQIGVRALYVLKQVTNALSKMESSCSGPKIPRVIERGKWGDCRGPLMKIFAFSVATGEAHRGLESN